MTPVFIPVYTLKNLINITSTYKSQFLFISFDKRCKFKNYYNEFFSYFDPRFIFSNVCLVFILSLSDIF